MKLVFIKAFTCLLLVSCACFFSTMTFAAGNGRVTGQVIDSKNNIKLAGVQVTSKESNRKAVTDPQGEYNLSLPTGEHTLVFSYLGYTARTQNITVKENETTTLNIDFSADVFTLEELVVRGYGVGQARALNRQKTAPNLTHIVASDAFGRFPDQNAAEALDRLPGVSIARDQGEGRFVIVRGIQPDLNTASVDGISLAAPDPGARSVLLDVLPMNVMETLVVTKSLTPDMPGDSIGGHVDIEMPSAYDKKGRTVSGSIGGNYSDLTEEWAESLQAAYGEAYGDDQAVGFFISASWDKRELGSDNVESAAWELNDDDIWETEEVEFREYDLTRERLGITSNLEFRPTDDGKYFLRGLYGEYEDHEYRRRTILGDMGLSTESLTTEAETAIEMKDRTETQKNLMVSAGGENILNTWTLDYTVAYSYAEQDTPDDTELAFEYDDILEYTFRNVAGDTPGISVMPFGAGNLGGYEFDGVEDADQIVEEEAWLFEANLKKELDTRLPAFLKAGFYASIKNKTSDLEVYTNDENPENFDTLDGNTSGGRYVFAGFPLIDKSLTGRFEGDIDAFEMEREEVDSAAEDYETDETVYAGYLMGNVDVGIWNLLAGARVEFTDLKAAGYVIDEGEDSPVLGMQKESNDYTNFLPGFHARADITDNFIFYGAWTNTISRPNWEQTRYARTTDDDEMEVGNPDLDPYEAMNWDATLSYYMPSVGVASIGVFYKDIDNFIYSTTTDAVIGGETFELTTWSNGESASIYGLELAYEQNLSFLPSPLDGLSIQGNLTVSESEADTIGTDYADARSIDFVGNSDLVGSFAVSFEKWNFFARLSGTYRSEYLDSPGAEAFEDEYIDDHFQLDLSTSYTFQNKYTIFANLINLNNEPWKAYYGESKRLRQYEEYGWSARAGVKFNF